MLHNRDCCLDNDKTPPLHTHPLTHTHTQILLRQQDILRPHDLTGWFNVCSYTRLMRWPPSDVLELFLLRDILPPSPQRWSTTVQFDEQIKHSPHFTSFTQTIPLFMAAHQSRASKTKQKSPGCTAQRSCCQCGSGFVTVCRSSRSGEVWRMQC